jgi:hypothetical protein
MDSKMDPIAFFDHLAANSATSQSSHGEEGVQSCSSISNSEQDSYSKHHQQLTASHSLETIKPSLPRQQEFEMNDDSFQNKWNNLVQTYRIEKEVLGEHLKVQLIALAQVEEHFDKANMDLHQKIENSYHQLQKDLTSHQYHINNEKKQFEREKELIKGRFR